MAETVTPPWLDYSKSTSDSRPPWEDYGGGSDETDQGELAAAEKTSDLAAAQKQARLSGLKSERALSLLGGATTQAERLQPTAIVGTISKNIADLPYAVGHAINSAIAPEAPRIDPEKIKPFIRHAITGATTPSIGEENTAAEGVVSGTANVIAGLASPETAVAIASGAAAPEVVGKLFLTDIAGQLPGSVDRILSAKTSKQRAEAGVELAAQVGTLKLIHSGLSRAEPKPGPMESLVDAEARRGMTPTQPAISETTLDRLESESKSPEVPTKVLWSSSKGSEGSLYLSDRPEDAKAYSMGRPIKQYEVKVNNPFDPSTSSDSELVKAFDQYGGIYEAPRNPEFRKLLQEKGYDSVVGGESGFGGESNWLVIFDKSKAIEAKSPETKTAEVVGPATAQVVAETKGIENAPTAQQIESGVQPQRIETETRGIPAETSPSDSVQRTAQGESPQGSVNAPELAVSAQGTPRNQLREKLSQQEIDALADKISDARIDAANEIESDPLIQRENARKVAFDAEIEDMEAIAADRNHPDRKSAASRVNELEVEREAIEKGIAQRRDEITRKHVQAARQIGIAPGATAFKAISDKLASFREKIASGWASRGNKADIARLKDAADSESKIIANQQRNSVELEASKEFGKEAPQALKAVTAVIETGGDRAKLLDFYNQSYGKHLEATQAAEFAQTNWDRLQPLAAKIKAIQDNQIAQEHLVGIDTEYRENYIRHAYDVEKLPNRGAEFFSTGRAAGSRSGFKAARKFETLYDAIEAGYGNAIKSFNAAKLVESRLQAGQQLVNDRMWVNGFKSVNDPTTGKPIIGPPVKYDANHFPIAAPGYDAVGIAGQFVAVHNGYRGIFDAVTGGSKIQGAEAAGLPVGAAVLNTAAGIKHGLLLFDTFHASRIMQKQFFLTGKVGYAKGLSVLEYTDADLAEAVRQGEITPEMARFATANRPTAQLLVKQGLNVGRIQEALRSEVVRNWPIVGSLNKWVFDKLTRGAMMEAGLTEFERVQGANPGWTPERVAAKVAKDINVTFGNIGRQGVFRSRTGQDFMRLVALAPQWVESMARSEIGGFGQLASAPFNGMKLGTLGKTMAGGLITYVAATQVLNYITRGHSTFDNPEEGHKLDAWVPDLAYELGLSKVKTPGFFLNPLSVVAELTHDAYRYAFKQDNALDILGQIGQNKMGPLLRSQKVLWTGKNYSGEKIVGTWNRIKQSGAALVPAPIPFSGFASDRPGQAQRQITGSLGLKTEPAPTALQQIQSKANSFKETHGKPSQVDIVYHDNATYKALRKALVSHDEEGAKAVIQELRKTSKDPDIAKAMNTFRTHPFTGSAAMEGKFKASLSPQDRELYDKAKAEKKATFEQFQKVWRERGPRPTEATTTEAK